MIIIICSGSRGDFQPYIALEKELKKQGKEVRITAAPSVMPPALLPKQGMRR